MLHKLDKNHSLEWKWNNLTDADGSVCQETLLSMRWETNSHFEPISNNDLVIKSLCLSSGAAAGSINTSKFAICKKIVLA